MKVSVIVPVYNAAEYLHEAVSSALSQPQTAEVLIVDDASKDDSLQIARDMAASDNRIRVLTHPGGINKGSAETRNVGIRAAQFDYIAFIDADDWFAKDRFKQTEEIFKQHLDADGVFEAVKNVKTEKAFSKAKSVNMNRTPEIHMIHREIGPDNLLELLVDDPTGIIMLQGLCVKRNLFLKSGLFDTQFRIAEDMLLIKKMAAVGNLYHGSLNEPVSFRRIHDSNITFSEFKDQDTVKDMEADVLFMWAVNKSIPSNKMNAIIRFWYRSYFYKRGKPFTDKLTRVKWAILAFKLFPGIIKYRQFWSAIPAVGAFVKQ